MDLLALSYSQLSINDPIVEEPSNEEASDMVSLLACLWRTLLEWKNGEVGAALIRCSILVDWELILADDSAENEAEATLNGQRFTANVY